MYETVKRLYQAGKLTEKGLDAAIVKGWVTQAQAEALKQTEAEANE